jgi:hypothetical protein
VGSRNREGGGRCWYLKTFNDILLCFPNSIVHLCLQTCKFFIKVLVRNESFLNVRTSDFEDMGYNLKRDGWLNSFTDLKNQSMRDDGVPWRGAREKLP